MGVCIHPIALGFDCCYLIRGEKIIMIDGGAPKSFLYLRQARMDVDLSSRPAKISGPLSPCWRRPARVAVGRKPENK